MADVWQNITIGMKVEVMNHEWDFEDGAYWIATVVKIAGKLNILFYFGIIMNQTDF